MTIKGISIMIALAFISIAAGCSSAGNGNATTPEGVNGQVSAPETHQLWGLWRFTAHPDKGSLDITPLRTGEMHLNALPFLEPPPLLNLTLESLKFEGDIVKADIGLRHPFFGLSQFTGFDVCGIFISKGTKTGFDDVSITMAGEGDTRLLNPDGFTRWWNPAEFPVNNKTMFAYNDGLLGTPDAAGDYNSTINGYKYYCDSLGPLDSPENIPVNSRGVFYAGQKNIRHYEIKMDAGLVFNYAVDTCWVFPTGAAPWQVPGDFPPEANRPEAYRISVTEIQNSLFWNQFATGGELRLAIDVYDWFNADANIVRVESPGNFTIVSSSTPSGGGDGYSTYEVDITDTTLTSANDIELLITVESDQVGYGGLLPGKTVSSYFTHTTPVSYEPPNLDYNFTISTNRSATGLIEGIKLEWTTVSGYPEMNIYKKLTYDPDAKWALIPDSPVNGTEYVDKDFLTYEGYSYYIAAWNGSVECAPSQIGFIVMQDAEETVNTFNKWEDDWRQMGDYYERWGPLGAGPHSPPPANGTYSWDESAIENFPTYPGDFWTGFWMLLCSPILPVKADNTTAYVEFMSRIQTYDNSPPADNGYPGGKVGVSSAVDNDKFYPADDYREGFAYPVTDVPGLYLWGQFPNCSNPEPGYAGDYSYWQFTSYYLNDALTISTPRAGFAFGSVNYALGYGWNVDDIAVIVY